MKLGIMQPYFFAYLGYYDLMNRTDRWVVFDTVKYTPKTWMNRNRILHPTEGWQYVGVPVDKRAAGRAVKDVVLLDPGAAHRRILGQIEHYRKGRAPFFEATRDLVDRTFAGLESDKLAELNLRSITLVCAFIGIPLEVQVLSRSELKLPPVDRPGDWALEIGAALGADEYVNPPNGRELFDAAAFAARGIALSFTDLIDFRYACGRYQFVERLSIIDVLMWNAPEVIKGVLDERKFNPVRPRDLE